MIPSTQAEIDNIFKEIDKDKDGAISKQDLESTQYANTIFGNSPAITAVSPFTLSPSTPSPRTRWTWPTSQNWCRGPNTIWLTS